MNIFFIFRLLLISFKDIFFILPFFLFLFFFWVFFIRNNFLSIRINPSSDDVILNSKIVKKINHKFFNNWVFANYIYFFIFLFFIKIDYNVFWFNHLKINNLSSSLIFIIVLISLIFYILINNVKNDNNNYSIDYFSALINLIIIIPIIFLSNTIYTFLFVLELISLLIFYKFSVSRTWFSAENNKSFSRLLPKSYLNMMFFQYWANFFSSMFIMFSVFNLIFIFGSSDWTFIEILYKNDLKLNTLNNYVLTYIFIFFFIGFFLKIGFSPLHLFKIEVYKGIPFISIFFYTSIYFISFFLYFIILTYNNLNLISSVYNLIFIVFILTGLFYSIILLFDVNLIKSFFAYSTVINAMNFIIVLYLLIN